MSSPMRSIGILVACAFANTAATQESRVQLVDGAGKDKAGVCVACHSLDYIQMNGGFLDKADWTTTINKMINAYDAPVAKKDVDTIAAYLVVYYGKAAPK